jgi:hypothetical protein
VALAVLALLEVEVTFFEALKANETKRVRQVGDIDSYEPKQLIKYLEQTLLDVVACNCKKWEAVEEPIEFWLPISEKVISALKCNTKKEAIEISRAWGFKQVAMFREVSGTREMLTKKEQDAT